LLLRDYKEEPGGNILSGGNFPHPGKHWHYLGICICQNLLNGTLKTLEVNLTSKNKEELCVNTELWLLIYMLKCLMCTTYFKCIPKDYGLMDGYIVRYAIKVNASKY
jgi:hypothetical protein